MSYIYTGNSNGTYEFSKIDGQLVSMPTDGNRWCLLKTPDNKYSWKPVTDSDTGGTGGSCGCLNKIEEYECNTNVFECDITSGARLIVIDLIISDLMVFCNNDKPMLTCSCSNDDGSVIFYNKPINCLTNTYTVTIPFNNTLQGAIVLKCMIGHPSTVCFSKITIIW